MKVEIITPDADPEHGGFGARVYALISMFSQFADVRVVLADRPATHRVPGVAYEVVPLPDTLRARLGRLRAFYRQDFPDRTSTDPPDLVVIESLDVLGLQQYGVRVPFVLDEHNVYWNLLAYEIANSPFFRGWVGRRAPVRRLLLPKLLARAKRFEIAAIRSASRTLATSEVDATEILRECPDARIRVLPNCVDARRIPPLPESPASRDVVFVGSFNYVPNREAARFIANTLAAGIPDARFLLVGADPPEDAARPANVVATGHVPDLLPHLRDAAVCVAPLAHGSGTRIKLLTYFAASRAVVATTKACEGLPVRDGEHLLVRDDPQGFVAAVARLLEEPETRRRLGGNARRLVESGFDWRVHVEGLRALAADVCAQAVERSPPSEVRERRPRRTRDHRPTASRRSLPSAQRLHANRFPSTRVRPPKDDRV